MIVRRPLAGRAAARGEDPLTQEGVTRARPCNCAIVSRPVHRAGGATVTSAHTGRPAYRYRICVRGRLGEPIRSAFPALQARASGGDTVLTGPLMRQPAARMAVTDAAVPRVVPEGCRLRWGQRRGWRRPARGCGR